MVDSWRGLLAALVVIFLATLAVVLPLALLSTTFSSVPFVITTWPYPNATQIAWDVVDDGGNALDALEAGCNFCELNPGDCRYAVGFGSKPDEHGEVTLDAMIMDGATHDVGAVGCLRRVKKAISVARHVMDYTKHTLLVGDLAKQFAVEMGFKEESLSTDRSQEQFEEWKNNNCQPNFRQNVLPDPTESCGPYHPIRKSKSVFRATPHQRKGRNDIKYATKWKGVIGGPDDHDTIGMVVIDGDSNIAAGTSTNGLTHKIPGRVGDSPIMGAGAYAENGVGGAAATGNGDIMMRFLPSYQAVESMRSGVPPEEAARLALRRITRVYTDFLGAMIVANSKGEYGSACVGYTTFPFYIHSEKDGNTELVVECDND